MHLTVPWEHAFWIWVAPVGLEPLILVVVASAMLYPLHSTGSQHLVPLAWVGGAATCIPTYQADGDRSLSGGQAVEPTQGCWTSPTHLPRSCPGPAQDQGQAVRWGTGLMMAAAMPSLSCPGPRVQFQLTLFPVDKTQTSSFYLFWSSVVWEARGGRRVKMLYVIESL